MEYLQNIWQWWSQTGLDGIIDGLRAVLPANWEWVQSDFMLMAVIECILLAPICAAMGVKVVNFRMAFFSDAISHSAFAGVAIGLLIDQASQGSFDPRIALVAFGLLVGFGIAAVSRKTDLSSDTVIGVFFSAVVALGIAIISSDSKFVVDFQDYLYGSIVTLDAADIAMTAMLAIVVFLFMVVGFNRLTLIGLNHELAHSRGVPVRLYDYLFSLLLALVVTVSIRTVGILLVTAMLIVPAAAARNVASSAGGMFRWALAIGIVSAVGGTLISFKFLPDTGTGAVIVLVAAGLFLMSFFARRG